MAMEIIMARRLLFMLVNGSLQLGQPSRSCGRLV